MSDRTLASTLHILVTRTLEPILIMAVATAKMYEFQPESESIEAYLERVEIYFDVNAVEDDKKVAVFLKDVCPTAQLVSSSKAKYQDT